MAGLDVNAGRPGTNCWLIDILLSLNEPHRPDGSPPHSKQRINQSINQSINQPIKSQLILGLYWAGTGSAADNTEANEIRRQIKINWNKKSTKTTWFKHTNIEIVTLVYRSRHCSLPVVTVHLTRVPSNVTWDHPRMRAFTYAWSSSGHVTKIAVTPFDLP